MAEPQPAGVQEGEQGPSAIPASSEDRKAAADLSNLDSKADNDTTPKQADTEALGKAMQGLDVSGDGKTGNHSVGSTGKEPSKTLVKVDPADVTLLAQHLDLSKPKATELLKAHEADVTKAITAWITAS